MGISQTFKPVENFNPVLTSQNQNWNYNMGYRFLAETDGDVISLGGRWAVGITATVRLYSYPAGAVLASASVTGAGTTFNYTSLGSPVAIASGNTYVVAVRLIGNSSGCYSAGQSYPESYGGIEILGSTYLISSDAVPTNLITNAMYGQADLEYQPCSYAGDISSSANSIIEGSSVTLSLSNNIGNIKWQKSTDDVNFNDIPGALGTQFITPALFDDTYYRILVTSGSCADTSNSFRVEVLDPEYPLRVNNPAITAQNNNWDYNMGYRFSPTKDGQISELGGRWTNGVVHNVRLYSSPAGAVLATASVTGSESWNYEAISPLTVSKDSTYFVAVRLDGQNSGIYSGLTTPFTEAGIEILSAGYIAASNALPTNNITNFMYGQADIKFEPCVSAGLLVAAESSISIYDSTDLYVIGNSGSVSWQPSTDGISFSTIAAGIDTIETGKLSVSTFYRTIINGGCADDTSTVIQVIVTDPSYVLQSASQVVTGQSNNWNFNMGYRFTALTNGQVEELGGRWRAGVAHTVRLYAYPAGTQLASVSVTGNGTNWVYSSISPVNLSLGQQYVVAVRLDGQTSGMFGTLNDPLPYVGNQIEINTFSFLSASNAMPTNAGATNYGMADIKFTPCVYAGEAFISDTLICPLGSVNLELKNSIGNIQWQESSDNITYSNLSGATDTVFLATSIVSPTYYKALISDACGSDTLKRSFRQCKRLRFAEWALDRCGRKQLEQPM